MDAAGVGGEGVPAPPPSSDSPPDVVSPPPDGPVPPSGDGADLPATPDVPPPRKRSRLRKFVLACLVLSGSFLILIQTEFVGALFRDFVGEQLSVILGETVTLGRLELDLVPLGLSLGEVAITSTDPTRQPGRILYVEHLQASLVLRDLPDTISIPSVVVEGLDVDLHLKEGKPTDFAALMARLSKPSEKEETPTPEGPPKPGPQLNLGKIRLKDAHVHVIDDAMEVELTGLFASADFRGGLDLKGGQVSLVSGHVRFKEIDETVSDVLVRLRGEGEGGLEKITLEALSLNGNGLKLEANGWVKPPRPGQVTTLRADPDPGPPMAGPSDTPAADATPAPGQEPPADEDPLAFLEGMLGGLDLKLQLDLPLLNRVVPGKLPTFTGHTDLSARVSFVGPEVRAELELGFADLSIDDDGTVYRVGDGSITAKGDRTGVDVSDITLNIGQEGQGNISGRLNFDDTLSLSARLDVTDLELAELLAALDTPDLPVMVAITGGLDVTGSISPFHLMADAQLKGRSLHIFDGAWTDKPFNPLMTVDPITLEGAVDLDGDRVTLKQVLLGSDNTRILADFTYNFEGSLDLQGEIQAVDLADLAPIDGVEMSGTGWADLHFFGPTDDLRIWADVSVFGLVVLGYPIGDIETAVYMPFEGMSFIQRLEKALPSGRFDSLTGGGALDPTFATTMVNMTHTVDERHCGGRLNPADDTMMIFLHEIHGRKGSTIFQGDMGVFIDDPIVLFGDLNLPVGRVEDILALAQVDLGADHPLRGDLTGQVHVEGDYEALDGVTEGLTITSGYAYGETFERLELAVKLDKGSVIVDRAYLQDGDGQAFAAGSYATDGSVALELKVEGMPLVDLEGVSDADLPLTGIIDTQLTVWGNIDAPHLEGTTTVRGVAYGTLDLGDLRTRVETRDEVLFLTGSLGKRAELSAELDLTADNPWRVDLQVMGLPFHPFIGLSAPGVKTTSALSASLSAAGALGSDEVPRVLLRLDELFLAQGKTRIQNYGPADVVLKDGHHVILSRLHLIGDDTDLRVSGEIDVEGPLDLLAEGSLDLGLLDVLVTDTFQRVDGKLTGPDDSMRLHIGGSLDEIVLSGDLALENMAVRAEAFPQTVDNLSATIHIDDNEVQIDQLRGSMGGGRLDGSGEIRLDTDLLPSWYNLKVGMDEVVIRYPDYLPPSQVHGDLAFQGESSDLLLSGTLFVDRSIYRERINWERDLLDFRTYRLEDLSAPTTEEEAPLFAVSVAIKGDGTLYVRNNLGNLQMSCDMMLEGDTNNMGVRGDVKLLKGQVYLLDNEMEVVEGTVSFLDPREFNPFLDIRLSTEIRTYTIGYHIYGSWVDYQLVASSDAGLSERDINSLLAFGVLADELQGSNASAVATPALEFLAGSLGIQEQLEAVVPFKFDRLGFTPVIADNGSTTVRLYGEKELKEDQWFSSFQYSIGESQDYNFTLEYRFNDTLSFIADLDEGRKVTSSRLPNVGARTRLRWDWE